MFPVQLAGCVIQDHRGHILLLHRNTPGRQQWEIPGGKIDPGEDARTTAVRELREEVGVEVALERLVGTRTFIEDDKTMIYTWFLATIVHGVPHAVERHIHDRCEFVELAEIIQLTAELSPNTKNFITEVLNGHIQLATKPPRENPFTVEFTAHID